jgi:uncharacterized protein
VLDRANLLAPEQEQRLAARSAALEKATGHQLVVVTVPNLHGQDIATFGVDLGRRLGVGRKDINDGVLLIVAPRERKARIEVGYGLEKALRDEDAGRIMRDAILPAFGAGDMPRGIAAGVDGIIREIGPGAGA